MVFAWPGDPELFLCLDVVVVGFDPKALQALKLSASIVDRFAGLRKVDTPYSGLSDQAL